MGDRQMVAYELFDTVKMVVDWLNNLPGKHLNSIEVVDRIEQFQIVNQGEKFHIIALVNTRAII